MWYPSRRFAPLPIAIAALLLLSFASIVSAQITDCSNLPPPDPRKNFFDNFMNPCYVVRPTLAPGSGRNMTDFDQLYGGFFYRVNPNYELIVIGEFPRARIFSITLDDSHYVTQSWYTDKQLKPLSAAYVNPYAPGVAFKEDQLYTVAVQFGGKEPGATAIPPGCGLGGIDIHQNPLDATKRHAGMSWNGDPRMPAAYPPHDDVGPNKGGMLTVRQYLRGVDLGTLRLATPVVITRDLRTGCAVPAAQAVASDPTAVTADQVMTWDETIAATWVDIAQIKSHEVYRGVQPAQCYALTPSPALWFRPPEYVPLPNPDAAYLLTRINPQLVSWLVQNEAFMRIRFKLPLIASLPCDGCTLTGTEQLRYFNLSFYDSHRNTLASLGDFEIVRDPNGYATVLVGFGAAPPAIVTAANFYTYVDLSASAGFTDLAELGIRTILPAADFTCSAAAVASFTSEDNSLQGFMGEYAPVVDFLRASGIPTIAGAFDHPTSCGLAPPEPAAVCR